MTTPATPLLFEPENDLERSLMRAATDKAYRPEFLRGLMEAEIFVVLLPVGGAISAGADGKAVVPAGVKLELGSVRHDGQILVPFFTAPVRARAVFKGDHIVAPEKLRDAFMRYRDAPFVLNPGSAYGKEFPREEINRLLAGDFDEGLRRVTIDKETKALISSPAIYPAAVAAGLTGIFKIMPSVKAACLGQITMAGEGTHLLIAIDTDAPWDALLDDMRPRLAAALPSGEIVNFTPLSGGSFEGYFRNIAPFYIRRPAAS